jgi:outer membrane protein assembly factor BamB
MNRSKSILSILLIVTACYCNAQSIAQWRGINRDGIYEDQQLLKTWPVNGPELLWAYEDLGDGFGSVAATSDMIFINGKIDSLSYTFAFNLQGKLLWKAPNGIEFTGKDYSANFPGPRSTPTVLNDYVYVSSGLGRIACLEKLTGKEIWYVDMLRDYNGVMDQHGYCESLVVDDKKVYCLPGGIEKNVVAIDRFTGKTVWTSKALSDSATYCSPIIIKLPTRSILVTFSGHDLLGLDTETGQLLWSHHQAYSRYHQHCNMPIYSNGSIFYIAGEGNGAVKLDLSVDGTSIKEVWRNSAVNNAYTGFVKIDNQLFSPDKAQKIKCIDSDNGQVVDSLRVTKGGIISAEGMLYCYSENGNVNLIKLDGAKMEIVGEFKCTKGSREHFAHPVIGNGVLYLRHGKALMAYDIKQH